MVILSFKGKYAFLSNFSPHPVRARGILYPTVEHAYQAYKTLDPAERLGIRSCDTPGQAKRAGRRVTLRPDWDNVKLSVMTALVKAKFRQHPELAGLLKQTGDALLVEGNYWHDNFWGVCGCKTCPGVGKNWLGCILIGVRNEL